MHSKACLFYRISELGTIIIEEMNPEALQEQGKSRQDQILLLAAEGMTDKEIAARLTLSPETVGTYWRRILSKYSAASRTEVVAKVVRLQAEASIDEISELNECLREVTDHLLLELSGRHHPTEAEQLRFCTLAMQYAKTQLYVLDEQGFVRFSNREYDIANADAFEWQVFSKDQETFRDAMSRALSDGTASSFEMRLTGAPEETFSAGIHPIESDGEAFVLLELVPESRRT
jgi:DNA-binding CsgD family transcriptional regulator